MRSAILKNLFGIDPERIDQLISDFNQDNEERRALRDHFCVDTFDMGAILAAYRARRTKAWDSPGAMLPFTDALMDGPEAFFGAAEGLRQQRLAEREEERARIQHLTRELEAETVEATERDHKEIVADRARRAERLRAYLSEH